MAAIKGGHMNFIVTQPRISKTNDWIMSVEVRFMGSSNPVQISVLQFN